MKTPLLRVAVLAVLGGCAATHAPPASASTLTVSYTLPVDNTDGTPIPPTGDESLQTVRIEYGTCTAPNVFGAKLGEFSRTKPVGGTVPTSVTNNVPAGQMCVRVFVANLAGNESDASNVAVITAAPGKPKPATGVR